MREGVIGGSGENLPGKGREEALARRIEGGAPWWGEAVEPVPKHTWKITQRTDQYGPSFILESVV